MLSGRYGGGRPKVPETAVNDAPSSSGNVVASSSGNYASSSRNVASSSSRNEASTSRGVAFCSANNVLSPSAVVVNYDEEQFMAQYDVPNVIVENESDSGDSSSSSSSNDTSSETENVEANGNEKNEGSGSEDSSPSGRDDSSETDEFEENATGKKNESDNSSSSDSEISSTVDDSNEMNDQEQDNVCLATVLRIIDSNFATDFPQGYAGDGYEKMQQVNTYHIPPKIQDYPQRPIKQPSPVEVASTSKRSRSPSTGQKPSEVN